MHLRIPCLVTGLASFIACLSVYAQTDESFTTVSSDCSGIRWSDATLKRYPGLVEACQSVESYDGVTYVKFSATVARSLNRGKDLTLDLKDGGEVTVQMPEKTKLVIDGRVTPLAQLRRGDKLNFYVPQSRAVAQFHAANAPAETAPNVTGTFESLAGGAGD